MGFVENLRLSLEGLRSNKMRSVLTMLGIIIGIAAVIAILTVGDGLSGNITDTMSSLGASTISVYLQEKEQDNSSPAAVMMGMGSIPDEEDLITDDMVEKLRKEFSEEIHTISLSSSVGSAQAKDGRLYANVSISGVNSDYFIANETELLGGRFLKEKDENGDRMICLVSDKFVNNMFDGDIDAALGTQVSVETNSDKYRFRIVGIYKYEASALSFSMAADKDISTSLYTPISTAKRLSGADDGYSSITVRAEADVDSAVLAQDIQGLLNRYYRSNEDYSVSAMSMDSMIESVGEIMDNVSLAISIVAAISLLVGGIGVMNIMLVSVTERTREIGTRKALGATNANIRIQFVVESAVICLVGGIIGIILGTILGHMGSNLLDMPAWPSLGSIAVSVSFSLAIGIFFGYYPANKAAQLDPIDALRYE